MRGNTVLEVEVELLGQLEQTLSDRFALEGIEGEVPLTCVVLIHANNLSAPACNYICNSKRHTS